MNIARKARLIVWIGSAVGETITGGKILIDIGRSGLGSLNPWYLTFAIFSTMLLALLVVWYMEWLDARFAVLSKTINDGLAKEGQNRAAGHGTTIQMVTDRINILEDSIRDLKPKQTAPLRERVLQLRDEIQNFLKSAGDAPQTKRQSDMSLDAYQTAKIKDVCNWQSKIEHGFALRYADRAMRIFHECGEAGTPNTELGNRLLRPPRTKAGHGRSHQRPDLARQTRVEKKSFILPRHGGFSIPCTQGIITPLCPLWLKAPKPSAAFATMKPLQTLAVWHPPLPVQCSLV